MNCNDIKNLLADYLGDELESLGRTQFESHLSTCAPCRSEVAGLRQVQSEITNAPDISIELADQRSRCTSVKSCMPPMTPNRTTRSNRSSAAPESPPPCKT